MPKNERYYSQSYSLVDGQDNPSSTAYYGSSPNPQFQPGAGYQDHSRAQSPAFYGLSDEPKSYEPKNRWSRKRKWIIFGSIGALIVIIALAVGLGVGLNQDKTYTFDLWNNVTVSDQSTAFTLGGASKTSNNTDGIGAGKDEYTLYTGPYTNFPNVSEWVSFEDMWSANLNTLKTSCSVNKVGSDNSDAVNQQIYDAIQNRTQVSLVDHRFILAIILQESHGCVLVKPTTSYGGVQNTGIMQAHRGHQYDSKHSAISILAMVQDGSEGTAYGDGLAQTLSYYGNAYGAARAYNSGYIPNKDNLTESGGATSCYVSDVANRLTGWVNAESKCTE